MYARTYLHTYQYVRTVSTYQHVCMYSMYVQYIRTYVQYLLTNMYVCMYVHTYVQYLLSNMCVCMYVHIYVRTYVHCRSPPCPSLTMYVHVYMAMSYSTIILYGFTDWLWLIIKVTNRCVERLLSQRKADWSLFIDKVLAKNTVGYNNGCLQFVLITKLKHKSSAYMYL